MHVDRSRVAREGVAPDPLEQLVAREHEPAVIQQLPEQVELLRRELDLVVADANLATPCVDVQVAVVHRLALALAALGRRAAEDRLDARDELTGIERLRQVVVGADLEPDDLVDVLVTRRQHQDRHVARLANTARHLDPVDVRQHQVEDDQSGHLLCDLRERIHHPLAKIALQSGVNVFLEKPMCVSVEEADELLVLARDKGLRVGVNHNFLFSGAYRRLRDEIRAGLLGPLEHVSFSHFFEMGQIRPGLFDAWMLRAPGT